MPILVSLDPIPADWRYYQLGADRKWYSPDEKFAFCILGGGKTYTWLRRNLAHREGKPAVIVPESFQKWCRDGQNHREDGPAVEWTNGNLEWWINGKLHRTDGPAIIKSSGQVEWWMNGKFVGFHPPLPEEKPKKPARIYQLFR